MASYRKELLLTVGPLQVAVDLQSVKKPSQRGELKTLCDEHTVPLRQRMFCEAGEHIVTSPVKGVETSDGWRVVESDTRPKEESSKALNLTIVAATEIVGFLPTGNAYYCEPSNKHWEPLWLALRDTVKSNKYAFLTKGALRTGPVNFYMLTVHEDYLVLTEVEYPENIKAIPGPIDTKNDRETTNMFKQFVEKSVVPLKKFDLADTFTVTFNEWLQTGRNVVVDSGGDSVTAAAQASKSLKEALMDALN